MIRSIFTRDGHASGYDPAVPDAIAADELKFGDTIPSGTYLDMAVNLPLVDPKRVKSPVLMVRAEHDGNSTNEDLLISTHNSRMATASSSSCRTPRIRSATATTVICCGTRCAISFSRPRRSRRPRV